MYQSFGGCTKSTNYNWYNRHFHVPQFVIIVIIIIIVVFVVVVVVVVVVVAMFLVLCLQIFILWPQKEKLDHKIEYKTKNKIKGTTKEERKYFLVRNLEEYKRIIFFPSSNCVIFLIEVLGFILYLFVFFLSFHFFVCLFVCFLN